MISELAGFTLSRTIPDSVLSGVLSGAYKVFGGVVRDNSGRIVAHLINTDLPSNALSAFASPVSAVLSGINTIQLHSLKNAVNEVMTISQATMAISGLSLAVSASSFFVLNAKLNRIDEQLQTMAKEVKSIKAILEVQERSRLITALKTLRELPQITDKEARRQMLINSRQTLGELHEQYKIMLLDENEQFNYASVEEYFRITALGNAMCSAELGLLKHACEDLIESYELWHQAAKNFVQNKILTDEPERFLSKRYTTHVKSMDVINWMDFVSDEKSGIEHLDRLRDRTHGFRVDFTTTIRPDEQMHLGVARKVVARDNVLKGYLDQLHYLDHIDSLPSELNAYIAHLSPKDKVDGCYLFINDNGA